MSTPRSAALRLALICALLVTACGGGETGEESQTDSATNDGQSATSPQDDGGVDQQSPRGLAESIFRAAVTGELDSLAGIADPRDSDGDSKRVAGVGAASAEDQESFRSVFKTGKVVGEPRIDGDLAEVDFLFGPDGTREETFKMRRSDGVWYLQSF